MSDYSPHEIDSRFKRVDDEIRDVRGEMRTGFRQAEERATRQANEIKDAIAAKAAEPPKLSLQSIVAIGILIGGFWAVVELKTDPMEAAIHEYAQETDHGLVTETLTELKEHDRQQAGRLEAKRAEIDDLQAWRLEIELWRGYQNRATEEHDAHMAAKDHPEGVLKVVERMAAELEALQKETDRINRPGSDVHRQTAPHLPE